MSEVDRPKSGVNEDIGFKPVLPGDDKLIETARGLFLEYARSLDFSLCFQDFDKELASLPGDYCPPAGKLILAYQYGRLAGCIAMRKFDRITCEMKRLYVKPEFRGKGIGKILAQEIIDDAKQAGYTKMFLDTVPSMKEAISLYHSLGFIEIEPYRPNPIAGAKYMSLVLNPDTPR